MSPTRVALIGSRGVPARYGGYETLVEKLGTRLVEKGFQVTVYCRSHYTPKELKRHQGVELIVLPTVRTKYLDTPVHTLLACLDAAWRRFDAALLVNSANAIFLPILRAARIPVALHVDGIEKRRAKWGAFGRFVYAASERLACVLPNALVTDAEVIREYYRKRYDTDSTQIAYGVDVETAPESDLLPRLGLESRRFFLYVSRFEPENNPHRIAAAYRGVGGSLPLVMVGGAPYANRFIREFTSGADPRILFPGPIYGAEYRELLSHALAYVHATEVGGTHPALVEAMGYGNCVVVNDTQENREVAGETGLYFDTQVASTLQAVMEEVRAQPQRAMEWGLAAAERAARLYSWDRVSEQYAKLFDRLSKKAGTREYGNVL